jgi:hypothetical protein
MVIRDEYLTGDQTVVKKLDWLQDNGWDQVWRARGDGDCFYRCKSLYSLSGKGVKLMGSIYDCLYTQDLTFSRSFYIGKNSVGSYKEG